MTAPALPSAKAAFIPIAATMLLMGVQLFVFRDFHPQIPLALGIAITTLCGLAWGISWQDLEDGLFRIIIIALPSMAIILLIGMIVGSWIAAGTVPTLVYYGLKLIDPRFFPATCLILCSIVSVALGTSWGTVATVGIALMGIGEGFGCPLYLTAGAVISGAFFGDKISPLSDTTNLAPAITGVTLYGHIRNMMPTTIPAMLVSLGVYLVLGLMGDFHPAGGERIQGILANIQTEFFISPLTLIPPALVLGMAFFKLPPIPSLFMGALAGGIAAMLLQGAGLHRVFVYFYQGYTSTSPDSLLAQLFTRGGILSMAEVLTLVFTALGFGGALEKTGCLTAITRSLLQKVDSFRSLQITSILSAIGVNAVTGDPYLAMVLPGRTYRTKYRQMGYSALNLSRAVEEGGTLMSPLIPWSAGGVFVISTLGLASAAGVNLLYIPFTVACWISPLIGMTYAWFGLFSPRLEPDAQDQERRMEEARQAGTDVSARLREPMRSFLDWYDPQHSMFFSSPSLALRSGVHSLNLPLAEALRHGDFGLGRLSREGGDFLVLEGEARCFDGRGNLIPTPGDATVAHSSVTRFDPQTFETIEAGDKELWLGSLLPLLLPSDNMIYALRLEGVFPEARLAGGEVLTDCGGSVIGVYTPPFLDGAGQAGFTLAFLDRDGRRGGCLADARVERMEVSLMQMTKMEMCLPLTLEYLTADLEA